MSAALLQGVLGSTIDTDIWVDLPERQYIRLMNLCVKQGATAMAPTLYVLADGLLVNFLFCVHGLKSFGAEYKNAVVARLENEPVRVLPVERILQSKKTVQRDKDLPHILLLENFLKCRKKAGKQK